MYPISYYMSTYNNNINSTYSINLYLLIIHHLLYSSISAKSYKMIYLISLSHEYNLILYISKPIMNIHMNIFYLALLTSNHLTNLHYYQPPQLEHMKYYYLEKHLLYLFKMKYRKIPPELKEEPNQYIPHQIMQDS